jgi:exodeoxyribonuclease VII small subunit
MNDERPPATPFAEWEWALTAGSFEEVFTTLEAVVAHLEEGRLPLEHSIACYELGMRLAARCEEFLATAELRVSQLEETVARFYDAGPPTTDDEDDDADEA